MRSQQSTGPQGPYSPQPPSGPYQPQGGRKMGKKITQWAATLLGAGAATGLLLTGTASAATASPASARQSTAATAGHRIQIDKIYYNSPGTDDGSNSSLNHEWVRLYNTSSSKISLRHWTLSDAAGHTFKFATYSLGAHSTVKIRTGHGSPTQTNRYWNQDWYIWNNTGDTATLADSNGGTVDSCSYTGTSAGYVYC